MEAAAGESPESERARQIPSKPGEEQLREEGWSSVDAAPGLLRMSEDSRLNAVFES